MHSTPDEKNGRAALAPITLKKAMWILAKVEEHVVDAV
jgi:hypothetical protein